MKKNSFGFLPLIGEGLDLLVLTHTSFHSHIFLNKFDLRDEVFDIDANYEIGHFFPLKRTICFLFDGKKIFDQSFV